METAEFVNNFVKSLEEIMNENRILKAKLDEAEKTIEALKSTNLDLEKPMKLVMYSISDIQYSLEIDNMRDYKQLLLFIRCMVDNVKTIESVRVSSSSESLITCQECKQIFSSVYSLELLNKLSFSELTKRNIKIVNIFINSFATSGSKKIDPQFSIVVSRGGLTGNTLSVIQRVYTENGNSTITFCNYGEVIEAQLANHYNSYGNTTLPT